MHICERSRDKNIENTIKMTKLALFLCVYAIEEEKYQKILEADRKIGRLLGKIRKNIILFPLQPIYIFNFTNSLKTQKNFQVEDMLNLKGFFEVSFRMQIC